jgi:N-acetyl-gamma-glutamyl-phosphate reductase
MGASGYAGVELLRLCAGHPTFEVAVATAGSHAGEHVARHTPSLAAAYPSLAYSPADPAALDGVDVVFLALPHGESQRVVPALTDRVGVVVDLAADFRLHDPALYPVWYGEPHNAPELLGEFVTGLPELGREALRDARRIAVPGCYPTAALLALAPLLEAGLVATGPTAPSLIVDAASGTSGAGRASADHLHFAAVDEDFTAYGLLDHRHTPEIEQGLGAEVLFTPHLAPMVRGILATCYGRPAEAAAELSSESALAAMTERYAGERFVVVSPDPPSTKATSGSNCARITVRVDPRTGWVVSLCAIDNLIKGAAGQAVQCANLALGLPEEAGLPVAGIYP